MDKIEAIAEQVEIKPEAERSPESLPDHEVVKQAVNEVVETHDVATSYGNKVTQELAEAGSDPGIVGPELKELEDLRRELNEVAGEVWK